MEKNKYINKFDTFIEWLDYINGEVAKSPNVAYISDENILQLMKAVPESENIMFVKTTGWNGGDMPLNNINITLHRIGLTEYSYANLEDKTADITTLQSGINSYIQNIYKFIVPNTLTSAKYFLSSAAHQKLEIINMSDVDFSNVVDMSYAFALSNSSGVKLEKIIFSEDIDTSKVTDMQYMFNYCRALKTLDVSNFDTSHVTNMNNMFSSCESLTSLDVRNFDTSSITNAYNLQNVFSGCNKLKKLYLSTNYFNSPAVTNYDFSRLQSWDDEETLAMFVDAITSHDGTGKTVRLHSTTKNALTQEQKDAITGAGWTIQ